MSSAKNTTYAMADTAERLARLGWNAAFQQAFERSADGASGEAPARVVRHDRQRIVVETADGPAVARMGGRAWEGSGVAVGDWVAVRWEDGGVCVLRVLPRRSAFVRKAAGAATRAQVLAANVDHAVIVTTEADMSARRLERYVALVWESGAQPLVVIGKADCCDDRARLEEVVARTAVGVPLLFASALTGEGLDALLAVLRPASTSVLLGSSGVGKSTLVNALTSSERQRTGAVRADGRGRHTTTHRELLRSDSGALLIDTPGLRELALWDAEAGIDAVFPEIEALAGGCRFRDCAHHAEPGCAVLAAETRGDIKTERLAGWRRLRAEAEAFARRHDALRAAEQRAEHRSAQKHLRQHLKRKYR
jgi:ribosome biogenesis GTPase / thiamine phosphate phosphatase